MVINKTSLQKLPFLRGIIIKIISFVIVICILLPISAMAADVETESTYTFVYGERTIEIDAANISYEQARLIADKIANDDIDVSTYGIFCLFGHKIDTTYARETHHKEYFEAPICVIRSYRVEYCSRSSCSYSEATLTSTIRISCCE